jgi:chromosome segregation ATPase
VWTPGRRWPGGKEIEVEVLDQDECPTITERISPDAEEKRTFPHPTQIGRKAWARIKSDRQLTVRPVGDAPAEAVTLQAALAEALAKLADATEKVTSNDARASLAEREVVKLGEALAAANAEADLIRAELDIATTRADSAEAAAGKLTIERDELVAQLEQATAPVIEGKSKSKNKGGV